MDLLTIRLHHMASGTKRPVQFVDSPLEPASTAAGKTAAGAKTCWPKSTRLRPRTPHWPASEALTESTHRQRQGRLVPDLLERKA
jgi:hypothetical protein